MIDTLVDALPREIARVREEILPEYIAIGSAGAFAAAFIRADLEYAVRVMVDGDVVGMLRAYKKLKEYKT